MAAAPAAAAVVVVIVSVVVSSAGSRSNSNQGSMFTDPAEKISIDGVRSPFITSLVVRSRLLMSFAGSTVLHELSTNLSGAM